MQSSPAPPPRHFLPLRLKHFPHQVGLKHSEVMFIYCDRFTKFQGEETEIINEKYRGKRVDYVQKYEV